MYTRASTHGIPLHIEWRYARGITRNDDARPLEKRRGEYRVPSIKVKLIKSDIRFRYEDHDKGTTTSERILRARSILLLFPHRFLAFLFFLSYHNSIATQTNFDFTYDDETDSIGAAAHVFSRYS